MLEVYSSNVIVVADEPIPLNNVALYNGEEIVEVYGSISLDNLTDEDKKMLENGIHFTTRDEAVTAIEDYDG